jgi:hypothetical protein
MVSEAFADEIVSHEGDERSIALADQYCHFDAVERLPAPRGKPATALSLRLNVDVANETLLRMAPRHGTRDFPAPSNNRPLFAGEILRPLDIE